MRRPSTLILVALAAAVLVAGCSGSDYHYVKSSEDKTYFKVPHRWALFDEDAIIERLGADLTETERDTELDQTWRVAFDAAPRPTLRHLGETAASHPWGLAVVRNLTFEAADEMSNAALRNYFFDVDTALQNDAGDISVYEELQLDGGFRGVHLVATLEREDGRSITIDQTALVDQATTKVYALVVSCSDVCYDENRAEIREIVESWTVRDK